MKNNLFQPIRLNLAASPANIALRSAMVKTGQRILFSDNDPIEVKRCRQGTTAGSYVVGFIASDTDGNTKEVYTNVTVR